MLISSLLNLPRRYEKNLKFHRFWSVDDEQVHCMFAVMLHSWCLTCVFYKAKSLNLLNQEDGAWARDSHLNWRGCSL